MKGKKLENFRTKDAKIMADALIKFCAIMIKRDWDLFNHTLEREKIKNEKHGIKFRIYIERIR